MKKIKYFIVITVLLLTFSCENDGGTSVIDLRTGAVPNIEKSSDLSSFFNLIDLQNGDEVKVGYSLEVAQGDVTSADIVGFYFSGDNVYGPVTIESNINSFPSSGEINQDDIISLFDELSLPSDLLVGDRLMITAKLYLSDGTFINLFNEDGTRNYGSDVHTSSQYSTNVVYPISCPSDLGGTYDVISNGVSTDGAPVNNPLANFPYTVVVTDNGGGSYTISDGVAGVYIDWYSVYGYTFETEGNFTDVCNNLSGEWTEAFGCTVILTGTANGDGTLNIHWDNCFGDYADALYTLQ